VCPTGGPALRLTSVDVIDLGDEAGSWEIDLVGTVTNRHRVSMALGAIFVPLEGAEVVIGVGVDGGATRVAAGASVTFRATAVVGSVARPVLAAPTMEGWYWAPPELARCPIG